LPGYYLRLGRWDEGLELANSVIAEGELGSSESARLMRAWVQVLRGESAQPLEDTALALETARRVGAPQGLYPALAVSAFVRSELGDPDAARELLTELADRWAETELSYGAPADMVLTWFEYLGTDSWRAKYDTADAFPTAWLRGARALADEDFGGAVEIYEQTGARMDIASVQFYAARRLVNAGRRAEADLQLHSALAFYRAVGAARRVQQGEALLSATA
jgi:hypothetical protein